MARWEAEDDFQPTDDVLGGTSPVLKTLLKKKLKEETEPLALTFKQGKPFSSYVVLIIIIFLNHCIKWLQTLKKVQSAICPTWFSYFSGFNENEINLIELVSISFPI